MPLWAPCPEVSRSLFRSYPLAVSSIIGGRPMDTQQVGAPIIDAPPLCPACPRRPPMSSEPRVYRREFTWYYDLRIGPGRRERKGCGPHRDQAIAAAQARLRELRGDAADAPPVPIRTAPGSSLGDLFAAWLKHLRAASRKPNTWRSAESASHALLRILGRGRDARRLDPDMLLSYAEQRRQGEPETRTRRAIRPVTDATIHGELSVLRACLNWAVDRRLLKQMPCKIPMPKVERKAKLHLSPDRVEQLLDLAHTPMLRAFLAVGYFAGLRRDEALHLQWSGINLDPVAGSVHVEAVGDWCPKTHQDRLVPLNDRLREELDRWRTVCPESPWVFPSRSRRRTPTAAGPARTRTSAPCSRRSAWRRGCGPRGTPTTGCARPSCPS